MNPTLLASLAIADTPSPPIRADDAKGSSIAAVPINHQQLPLQPNQEMGHLGLSSVSSTSSSCQSHACSAGAPRGTSHQTHRQAACAGAGEGADAGAGAGRSG